MKLPRFCLLGLAALLPVHAGLIGPSAYVSFSDSPFAGGAFTYYYLEDFEDNALNTPGVTANVGNTSLNSGYSGSIVDSVDSDDLSIDGTCAKSPTCYSWFSGAGASGIRFSFSAASLGQLPTSAGIVWTDGSGTITFQAFDQNGQLIGTLSGNHADGNFFAGTAEDRFYGVTNAGGISSILISNSSGGIEVDHLQYGLNGVAGVPEPASFGFLALGLGGFALARRRFVR